MSLEEVLRERALGALASKSLMTVGETIGEFFTPPTTVVDISTQPDTIDVITPADDAVEESMLHDSHA